jgi:hypothetical protein
VSPTAPTGGNGTYTYQWKEGVNNATGTSNTAAFEPSGTYLTTASTYRFTRTVTSCGATTTTPGMLTLVVIATPAAPEASSPQTFCSSPTPTIANLSATGTDIKWYYSRGESAQLTPSHFLGSNVTYYASQTIDGCESAKTAVLAIIYDTPVTPTASSPQTFCSATNPTVANLSITSTATIKWYDVSHGGSSLSTTTALTSGATYYAARTYGGCESARKAVTVIIYDTPDAPEASSPQTFCSSPTPRVSSLSATGTAVKWYNVASGGSSLSTTTILTSATYYATQTATNGCESPRKAVEVTISPPPDAPETGPHYFCSPPNPTVADMVAIGTDIKWYNVASGGSSLSTTTALASGVYYATQTINGCESARKAVEVTVSYCTSVSSLGSYPGRPEYIDIGGRRYYNWECVSNHFSDICPSPLATAYSK